MSEMLTGSIVWSRQTRLSAGDLSAFREGTIFAVFSRVREPMRDSPSADCDSADEPEVFSAGRARDASTSFVQLGRTGPVPPRVCGRGGRRGRGHGRLG